MLVLVRQCLLKAVRSDSGLRRRLADNTKEMWDFSESQE